MPEFTTVPVHEAQLRTSLGRQGQFINEYADYIQQLSSGQAGRLRGGESENPMAIRRRLAAAAKAMHINLIIKRSGTDVYFWRENGGGEQPRTSEAIPDEQGRKRRYQPRISQLMNWEWLSKEYQRKNPRN
jgi:hypothetical protein